MYTDAERRLSLMSVLLIAGGLTAILYGIDPFGLRSDTPERQSYDFSVICGPTRLPGSDATITWKLVYDVTDEAQERSILNSDICGQLSSLPNAPE